MPVIVHGGVRVRRVIEPSMLVTHCMADDITENSLSWTGSQQ